MEKIAFKTVDGMISTAILKKEKEDMFMVSDMDIKYSGTNLCVPNLEQPHTLYTGIVRVYKSKVIWYVIKEFADN